MGRQAGTQSPGRCIPTRLGCRTHLFGVVIFSRLDEILSVTVESLSQFWIMLTCFIIILSFVSRTTTYRYELDDVNDSTIKLFGCNLSQLGQLSQLESVKSLSKFNRYTDVMKEDPTVAVVVTHYVLTIKFRFQYFRHLISDQGI